MKEQGFTLIEVVIFIIISGLIGSTILLAFSSSMIKTATVRQNLIATQTARRCIEWIAGQRRINGLSSVPCPSSTTPSFCSAPSGYTISTSINCTTYNGDANYETVIITVSGNGDAKLTTLLADY